MNTAMTGGVIRYYKVKNIKMYHPTIIILISIGGIKNSK